MMIRSLTPHHGARAMTTHIDQKRRNRTRRGVIVAMFGFMLVMLFGMCAFVADIGNVIQVKTTLGAAADAAALAGAGAMAQSYTLSQVEATAIEYGRSNVPIGYGNVVDETNVTFGRWDPESKDFIPGNGEPNAIRVVAERTSARGNAVPYFFAKIFGLAQAEAREEAIAVGAISTSDATYDNSVYVTSTKDLSNVVLEFADGAHQKFQGLHGFTGTFQGTGENEGKQVVGVWIKSGCNNSSGGPGYGERIDNLRDGATAHGSNTHDGCRPHVTASFQATGVTFEDSGAATPVRLVK